MDHFVCLKFRIYAIAGRLKAGRRATKSMRNWRAWHRACSEFRVYAVLSRLKAELRATFKVVFYVWEIA